VIIAVLILFGVLLGVLADALSRRASARAGNPMLDSLRTTLDEMERDYRLRIATEELNRDTAPPRRLHVVTGAADPPQGQPEQAPDRDGGSPG
jgi:hypothetical protein